MPKNIWRAPRLKRLGAAMLELALLLPLLLLLTGGIIDFARCAYFYMAVSDAAGEGAKFASFHPVTPTTLGIWNALTRQAALDSLSGVPGFDINRVTINNPLVISEGGTSDYKRVRVVVQYAFHTMVSWPMIPESITIRRSVEMRLVR